MVDSEFTNHSYFNMYGINHTHHYPNMPLNHSSFKRVLTLCLYGVEVGKLVAVERLVGLVPEGRHGQGLQVQQLGGGRVLLGQDEMAE